MVDLLAPGKASAPDKTIAIFKAPDIEVMRLVLPAGKHVPDHSVSGSLTVQCLRGKLDLLLRGQTPPLAAGQFTYLAGGVMHALYAPEDSELLVTLVVPAVGARP